MTSFNRTNTGENIRDTSLYVLLLPNQINQLNTNLFQNLFEHQIMIQIPVLQNEGGREGEDEGKYMYGDFDWSTMEIENRAS